MGGFPYDSQPPSGGPHCRLDLPRRAAALGMRRISFVRIELESGGRRCSVVGIGHRLPVVRPVPLPVAVDLARAGVPTVIHTRGPTPAPSCPPVRLLAEQEQGRDAG